MDRIHIPEHRDRDQRIAPGAWHVSTDGDLWHRCPECLKGSVMQGHSVAANGEVNPSIACFAPCGYHVWGTLDGWRYGVKSAGGKVSFTEETCPGHVASERDPKVCGRCGVHIDSLRPDDE